MAALIGIIAALIAALGWGSYFVPMKKLDEYDNYFFHGLMSVGIFVSSLVLAVIFSSFSLSYWGILSGILWSAGNITSIIAIRNIGLARTAPIIASIVIFSSFLWGTVFFGEILTFVVVGFLGILFLVIGVILISATTANDYEERGNVYLIYAIIAGLFFGSYAVPLKISGLEPISFLFPMSLGILVSGIAMFLVRRPMFDKRIIWHGISSGLIWNFANIASFFAIVNVGLAIGFPLTQLAMFISVIWGMVYFNEIAEKAKKVNLITGATFLFVGAVMLSLSV